MSRVLISMTASLSLFTSASALACEYSVVELWGSLLIPSDKQIPQNGKLFVQYGGTREITDASGARIETTVSPDTFVRCLNEY